MTVADRIAVMSAGRIEQMAPPVEIYERPASRYVADFLGDIALVEGSVREAADAMARLAAPDGTTLVGQTDETLQPGATAWLAVRPEKFAIAREGAEPAAANRLPGEVWDIAYLGGTTVFKVKLDAGPFAKVAVLNAHPGDDAAAGGPISWEERVVLTCRAEDALVLVR